METLYHNMNIVDGSKSSTISELPNSCDIFERYVSPLQSQFRPRILRLLSLEINSLQLCFLYGIKNIKNLVKNDHETSKNIP